MIADLGFLISDWKKPGRPSARSVRSQNPKSYIPNHKSTAFTLVEILITITIMAILTALFLGASRAAMEGSRASKTKSTIAKLNALLLEQYASYETRRVDIDPTIEKSLSGPMLADARLLAMRELMKFEMPDRWNDVTDIVRLLEKGRAPTVVQMYRRREDRAYKQALALADGDTDEADKILTNNESAECLYMIVTLLCGDGEARSQFGDQDVGDVDGDGAPEFLDGWGNPIRWIRWPAGFIGRSDLMKPVPSVVDQTVDHDPFDPFQRNLTTAVPNASSSPSLSAVYSGVMAEYVKHLRGEYCQGIPIGFRLVPLIYSSGPDGISDIDSAATTTTSDPSGIAFDPYAVESNGTYQFGTPGDDPSNSDGEDNSIDNIHNHTLVTR
jgi:competence protein ComGC